MPTSTYFIIGIFIVFGLLEFAYTNFFSKDEQTRDDAIVEILGSAVLVILTQPAIILFVQFAMGNIVPEWANAIAGINIFAAIALFLIFDDMTQYWLHRASHNFEWLYNLHRAHHNAKYMSIRLVYRNNFFYYLFMPGIWFSAVLIYLGLGWVFAGYIVFKMLVIVGAHSDVAWDKKLYAIPALSPIMWVLERTISTPATHHAHHGRHKEDDAVNYKGNFGNLLFFWDVLFGTAKITRRYPKSYGVENLEETSAARMLAWPIFRAKPQTMKKNLDSGEQIDKVVF